MAKNSTILTTTKAQDIFSKTFNPLRWLSKPQIEQMISNWLRGDDVLIQAVFSQVEMQSPIYQVCINKRTSGVVNRKWDIIAKDSNDPIAIAQAAKVKEILEECDTLNEDGLTAALEHLALASFRGRSCVKPFIIDGKLILKKLQNWNVLKFDNKLYWNPSAEFVGDNTTQLTEIPSDEVCALFSERPIDIPGIMIYLRQLIGEDTWSRFVEKQGIPQVLLTAPEGTPDTALQMWSYRAQQIYEGGSGTMPYGTGVNVLDSARGQDPFTEFLKHQMEMISILATGGTLMTIGGSTGLGSDLARVQQESFNSLVNSDCKKISNAFTNVVIKKICKALGYNEVLCRFTFVEDAEYSAKDYLEMAKVATDLGLKIKPDELKKLTNLSFIDDSEQEWSPTDEDESKEWTPEEKAKLKAELGL